MKKIIITTGLLLGSFISAQFKVTFEVPIYLANSDAYLYGFSGSKEILLSKGKSSNNLIEFAVDKKYVGMMRAYFQKANSFSYLVSENQNSQAKLSLDNNNKISTVVFSDQPNKLMGQEMDLQKKKDLILPALIQIKDYYKPNETFYNALDVEITNLSKNDDSAYKNHPFLAFYHNSQKFDDKEKLPEITTQNFLDFFSKSNEYLETSSMMKNVLLNYLNLSKGNVESGVDELLKTVNVESPRGQIILSELIDIFNSYNMEKLKEKYLKEAMGLKCTINDHLAATIQSNKNTEIGAKFPNNTFQNPVHTTAKSLYDVKADKKIVVFWASTCSHCEEELPKLLNKYDQLKAQNIQIIGMSVDSNVGDFKKKAEMFPWISASEGKGWYTSYKDTYNVNATPTYFVLDSNNVILSKPFNVGGVLEYLKIK